MPTAPTKGLKFYCKMHKDNRTHNTKDCYELNQRAKRAKSNLSHSEKGHVVYKDLNAFVNAK
eukprot:7894651-Ditylum_brightwellii.AAC.1